MKTNGIDILELRDYHVGFNYADQAVFTWDESKDGISCNYVYIPSIRTCYTMTKAVN